MAERRLCSSIPHMVQKPTPTPSMRELESRNSQIARRLSSVEEENASLALENRQLISELEAAHLELASSKTKVRILGSSVGSKSSSVSLMKEEIEGLEAEAEAQRRALREADERLEETQEDLVMKSRLVDELTEELMVTRDDLEDRAGLGIRVEQQRNEALIDAERQTLALQEYKENMAEKLGKVLKNEARLKEALIQCDEERGSWENRCSQLEQERADLSQQICHLKEDSVRMEALSLETAALRSRLEEASSRCSELERRLSEGEAAERDLEELRKENGGLQQLSSSQEQQLEQCQAEIQGFQTELTSLETILSLLHPREGGGSLCSNPCLPPGTSGNVLNLKPGEQYQRLLPVLQAVEQERSRQAALAHSLQERLSRVQEEVCVLQHTMVQRDQQVQTLHTELQERTVHILDLERELKRKSTHLADMEKQLEEKASEFLQAVGKNTELEQNLLEKSSSIQLFKTTLDTKHREFQQVLEESDRSHSERCTEQEDKIKKLQLSLDQRRAQLAKLEKDYSSAQYERREAQQRADTLHTSLSELTQEKETKTKQAQDTLRALRAQVAESTDKVSLLETALSTCRDELSSCIQRIKRAKGRYDRELDERGKEVEALRAEVRSSSDLCQSSSEQALQLQYQVQRQQAMLQESTSRAAELEDGRALLLEQISGLEKELEKEKSSASQELKMSKQRALEASQLAERHEREALLLSTSVLQLTTDMSNLQGELTEREKQLLRVRRDSDTKAYQMAKMEKMLQETKGLLEKKAESGTESKQDGTDNMVEDLEQRVRCNRRDRRNSLHHTHMLESQMKTVHCELEDTLDHLQELRNVLRRSQQKAEERKATMDKLAAGLSETQNELDRTCRELEEKKQEVIDKDTALRERQEELQQKTLQLSQLAVAVESHKHELEQKLILQQGALETSQREAREKTKQVEFMSERLELIRMQLQRKEDLEQEAMVQGQHLRACREKLQQTEQDLQGTRSLCESLALQLEEGARFAQEKENQVRGLEEELARMVDQVAQTEARLRTAVSSLRQELDTLRRFHLNELSALQESQAEMLKASECVCSTLRLSQDQLTSDLKHTRAQLEQTQGNSTALLAELQTREKLLQSTSEALLIKESEVNRLKSKISSLDRASELHCVAVRTGLTFSGGLPTLNPHSPPERQLQLPQQIKINFTNHHVEDGHSALPLGGIPPEPTGLGGQLHHADINLSLIRRL